MKFLENFQKFHYLLLLSIISKKQIRHLLFFFYMKIFCWLSNERKPRFSLKLSFLKEGKFERKGSSFGKISDKGFFKFFLLKNFSDNKRKKNK